MKKNCLSWELLLFGVMLSGCSSNNNNHNNQVGRIPPELVGKWNRILPDQIREYKFQANGSYSMTIRFPYELTDCIKSSIDPQCKKQYCGYFVVTSGIAIADENTIELIEKEHAEAQTDCYFNGDFQPLPPAAPKRYNWKLKVGQYDGDVYVKERCLYFDNEEYGYTPGSQLD